MANNDSTVAKAEATERSEFEAVKKRLEEIAREVDNDDISLDDALDLYEEAVKLGLKASSLLEVGIEVPADSAETTPPLPEPGTNPDAIPAPTPLSGSDQG